jgi:acetyl esterase/lipase
MHDSLTLWPAGAPLAKGAEDADVPTLTPFPPPAGKANGGAVIVCPGGGYQMLAQHEGQPVAEWLNTLGFAGFVLKYRIAPKYQHPAPMLDAQRAIRTVRSRAAGWGVNPGCIGILGFSAGGHLASTAGTHFDAGKSGSSDPIERASSRPDFQILVYPVVSFSQSFHLGSRKNLLGDNPLEDVVTLLSNEKQVTTETPPAFLVHSIADGAVPCENSILFAAACRKAGVPFELHLIERGAHGLGLKDTEPAWARWPAICAEWLKLRVK